MENPFDPLSTILYDRLEADAKKERHRPIFRSLGWLEKRTGCATNSVNAEARPARSRPKK